MVRAQINVKTDYTYTGNTASNRDLVSKYACVKTIVVLMTEDHIAFTDKGKNHSRCKYSDCDKPNKNQIEHF